MGQQQTFHQAALQHLAHLGQEDSAQQVRVLAQYPQPLTRLDHNPWAAEAALEAHLQTQQALVAASIIQQHQ
jgi:hypothetical protein